MPVGSVNHSVELHATIAAMFLNSDVSDVVIKVQGESFPAHSNILAAQSKFFKEEFHMKNKKEVTLSFTSPVVFREVLRYFYTGLIDLKGPSEDYASQLLELAKRYHLQSLQRDIVDDVCAKMLSDEPLSEALLNFYDAEAKYVLQTEIFRCLDTRRIQEILSRDTFSAEQELDVFNAIMKWRAGHSKEAVDTAKSVVRLALIPLEDLLTVVRPTGVFTDGALLDALTQHIAAPVKPRVQPVQSTLEENVASAEYRARVISGANMEALLKSAETFEFTSDIKITQHVIGDEEGIVEKLGGVYRINKIVLQLERSGKKLMSYYVEVSVQPDGQWTRVVDYRQYKCRGQQVLCFPTVQVKYVRIVGTASTEGDAFGLHSIRCLRTEEPATMRDGVLVPTENQALEMNGAVILEGQPSISGRREMAMLSGDPETEDSSGELNRSLKICLPQPVSLDSLRFRLDDQTFKQYSYNVQVSTDDTNWVAIADKSQEVCTSWQTLQFSHRPISFVKFINSATQLTLQESMFTFGPHRAPRVPAFGFSSVLRSDILIRCLQCPSLE